MRIPGVLQQRSKQLRYIEDFSCHWPLAKGLFEAAPKPWSAEIRIAAPATKIWQLGPLGASVVQAVAAACQVATQGMSIQAFLEPALQNSPCCLGTHMTLDIRYSQFRELGPACLSARNELFLARGSRTIVPKVTSPTKAFSGNRLKLKTNDSF